MYVSVRVYNTIYKGGSFYEVHLIVVIIIACWTDNLFPRSNVVELFTGSIYEEKNVSLCVFNAEYVMRITFK